jgi:hypothetical protein
MGQTAVVEQEKPQEVAPATSGDDLMTFIQRAALDPAFDVSRLERLIALKERQDERAAKIAYFDAMRALKLQLPIIERNGHIVIHEKGKDKIDANIVQNTAFARWEDIDKAITPFLDQHGFSLTFRTGVAPDGKVTVTGIATHELGHSEETTISLPHDSSGSKNPVQAVGSALSYGKRYAATMLLNIRTKGEDDDGQAAGAEDPISDDQIMTIIELLKRDEMDQAKFCKVIGVELIGDIKRKNYEKVITKINEVSLQRSRLKNKVAE